MSMQMETQRQEEQAWIARTHQVGTGVPTDPVLPYRYLHLMADSMVAHVKVVEFKCPWYANIKRCI
jgi:hypothetical protein